MAMIPPKFIEHNTDDNMSANSEFTYVCQHYEPHRPIVPIVRTNLFPNWSWHSAFQTALI